MDIYKHFLQPFAVIILAFLFFQNVAAQSRTDRVLIDEANRVTGDEFPFFSNTPNGARVYAVNQPTAKMLSAIDRGLKDLFAVAAKNNYPKRSSYSDYTIFIARPDRLKDINNQYSPDIAIGAAQYAGSIYDKGGYIYAAGMVLAFNPCAFVIGEHTKNFQRVSDVVRYEGEHLVLYHNNRRVYNKTLDHSRGGGHPILQ
ncbi:MAG: hypothetical protein M3525_14870 [Acidobacteriota bacterium]|nr:hypothetical protein [Acidobacteriota bacterium]